MFIRVFLYPATLPLKLTTLHSFILSVELINVIAYIIVINIVMVPQEQHAGAIFASQRSPVLGSPFIRKWLSHTCIMSWLEISML